MAANESDKDRLEVVVHLDDEAIFVPADVEDNPFVRKKTGSCELGFDLLRIAPAARLGQGMPSSGQWLCMECMDQNHWQH